MLSLLYYNEMWYAYIMWHTFHENILKIYGNNTLVIYYAFFVGVVIFCALAFYCGIFRNLNYPTYICHISRSLNEKWKKAFSSKISIVSVVYEYLTKHLCIHFNNLMIIVKHKIPINSLTRHHGYILESLIW